MITLKSLTLLSLTSFMIWSLISQILRCRDSKHLAYSKQSTKCWLARWKKHEYLLETRSKLSWSLFRKTEIAEISRKIGSSEISLQIQIFYYWNQVAWNFRVSIVGNHRFAFGYEDKGPDTFKWTKRFEVSEVKKLHDMLQELNKKLDHLQEVYLWRTLHETDIQSTTIRLAANSHALFIGCNVATGTTRTSLSC